MSIIVPPGGFSGFSQMTAASRAALFKQGRSVAKRKRKSASRSAAGPRKTRRAGKRKLKFGSPAFQKFHKVGKYRRK